MFKVAIRFHHISPLSKPNSFQVYFEIQQKNEIINCLFFQMFNFDVTLINWPRYLESYCLGVKQFVLKENMDCNEEGKQALHR
jgi:hypothetical protein